MVQPSESLPMAYYPKTKFEAFRAPGISIRDYLMRIHKYASCSPECFVLALVYIDRLHQMQGFILTELNVHRVVITSVVLAAKFFDDHYFNNAYYAKVGGVPCPEMNELEVEYLLLINFSLHVASDTYMRYYNELANHYIFTSVRNASLPASAYRQFRHYVTIDPEQDGQLVYVTDVVAEEPPRHHHHGHHSQHQYRPHPHYQPEYQQHHHRPRSTADEAADAEHGSAVSTKQTSSSSSSMGMVYASTGRTSGQKRRQSVALGVNA
ncbi:hypothetical protein Poli38472_012892 [Pythium oligandrum]|uniref:Cyclin n=1 Tax=Pythium oligandrum TaxID=41045 RepID=A0A8K1CJA1_PYTOL|nr:hypothetical protein Poli38472_012892 [Pythium oligandrum]|eukprot:TMW64270.1 hypothetical protein Poli38472_012892 [Pythium oligandrum]